MLVADLPACVTVADLRQSHALYPVTIVEITDRIIIYGLYRWPADTLLIVHWPQAHGDYLYFFNDGCGVASRR